MKTNIINKIGEIDYVDEMGDFYKTIVKCRPGITGYWRVNGRSTNDFHERLVLDKYYYHHRTFKMDFKIILKTVLKTFAREGLDKPFLLT